MVDCLDDCSMVPSSERVLTVNDVTFFKSHSPLKIVGFSGIRGNFKGMPINSDTFIIDIVEVLDFEIGFIDTKNFASAPDELIILAIGLDNVDKIPVFESGCELVV